MGPEGTETPSRGIREEMAAEGTRLVDAGERARELLDMTVREGAEHEGPAGPA